MKVLMLSWEYPPASVGGLARHVEELAAALTDMAEVHVLTRGGPSAPGPEDSVLVHRVEPYSLNPADFLGWVFQLNMALLEQGIRLYQHYGPFDILHAHDWLVAFAARALKHAYLVPLVATIHATEAGRNQGLHNDTQRYISSVEWWLAYEAWRVIVCSQHMRQEVRRFFQVPDDKLEVVPNGVRPERFQVRPDLNLRLQYAAPGEKIIFFVGRLVPEKGVQVLIQAMPAVLRNCPEAKLIVAGQGPMEGELKYLAQNLGLGPKVYFTGYLDDARRNALYAVADVAVFPSLYEPFGIVALEAMAAGTPVVVADTGGLGEVVTHGESGLKAFAGSAASLAENIFRVLREQGLADYLRQEAARCIASRFNWPRIAQHTYKVYQRVVGEAGQVDWGRREEDEAGKRPHQPYSLLEYRRQKQEKGAGTAATRG
ncbi:MAG: glycosyltransferase family 1 protein [Clostridia bacterium]|nr:MAG: glycosyltransferase family 1 protein [Clostridia bacterium]